VELIESNIHSIRNRIFPSNTYILTDEVNHSCLIIDPGMDREQIDCAIMRLNLNPLAIIATHGHFDHIASASFFKKKFNIPFYMHVADLKLLQSVNFYMKVTKINFTIDIIKPDYLLKGSSEIISVGQFDLNMINFPGHTNGSCIIQHKNRLFSGDIIYRKGMYFNNFPGENRVKLKESITNIFNMFLNDINTMIFPGHGESALLEHIKVHNMELIDFLGQNS
jgi:glyoxylase-like metal-dependent hydrolase (beta-lactamase superfamily II)